MTYSSCVLTESLKLILNFVEVLLEIFLLKWEEKNELTIYR